MSNVLTELTPIGNSINGSDLLKNLTTSSSVLPPHGYLISDLASSHWLRDLLFHLAGILHIFYVVRNVSFNNIPISFRLDSNTPVVADEI